MGQAVPRQQPAVVLRSQFNQLRALLAVALIAVAGLTVAVVILSNDADEVSSTSSAQPIESINYGGSKYVNPSTGLPAALLPQLEQSVQNRIDGTRSDGGPEEGTRGIVPPPPSSSHSMGTKDYSKNGATGDYAHGPLPPDAPAKAQSTSSESQYGTGPYRFGRP
jgi:hypothetical protein